MLPPQLDGNSDKAFLSEMDEGAGGLSVQRRQENRLQLVLNPDSMAPPVYRVLDPAQVLPAQGEEGRD